MYIEMGIIHIECNEEDFKYKNIIRVEIKSKINK
jgi:hypothetical protein